MGACAACTGSVTGRRTRPEGNSVRIIAAAQTAARYFVKRINVTSFFTYVLCQEPVGNTAHSWWCRCAVRLYRNDAAGLAPSKEFLCRMTEKMQADVPGNTCGDLDAFAQVTVKQLDALIAIVKEELNVYSFS